MTTEWTNERIDAACFAEFVTKGLRLMSVTSAASIMRRMRDELIATITAQAAEISTITAERDRWMVECGEVEKLLNELTTENETITAERDALQAEKIKLIERIEALDSIRKTDNTQLNELQAQVMRELPFSPTN